MRRDVQKAFGEKKPVAIAYGAAFNAFKQAKKGCVAVPTTGAFKACCNAFGRRNVHLIDEYLTSKMHTCGCRAQPTYRLCMCHKVKSEESKTFKVRLKVDEGTHTPHVATTLRRDGNGYVVPKVGVEVRGLRFCPECRIFCDRDDMAAVNMARVLAEECRNGIGARPLELQRPKERQTKSKRNPNGNK